MIHDYIDPVSAGKLDSTDATAMTHRTASQSFEKRRDIERTRTTIGSYEAAAKKSLIEAHDAAVFGGEAQVPKSDYYKDVRESLGIKKDDRTRNPYSTDRQGDRDSAGRRGAGNNLQALNAKTGGLAIPKRPIQPTFREPQGRSFNPFG